MRIKRIRDIIRTFCKSFADVVNRAERNKEQWLVHRARILSGFNVPLTLTVIVARGTSGPKSIDRSIVPKTGKYDTSYTPYLSAACKRVGVNASINT